ncbi:MAG: hypothetical protein ACXVXN_06130 [Mycobacteriaceae bacterium]
MSGSARLTDIVVPAPLRVMFLVVLIDTTLDGFSQRSRRAFKVNRWRKKVRGHTVIIGLGTEGGPAVAATLRIQRTGA